MFSTETTFASEVAKATPPVAVTGALTVLGMNLDTWVKVATLTYIVLQAAILIYNTYRKSKRRDRDDE